MGETLTEQVMRFKTTGEGRKELLDRIRIYVYRFPGMWTDWDEDRCSDFFMAFQSRIPGLVRRFRPDYSFETYLSSSLRWFMKSFTEKLSARERYESWAVEVSRPAESAPTPSGRPGYGGRPERNPGTGVGTERPLPSELCPFSLDDRGRFADPVLRRRILFVALLRSADLDAATLDGIAGLAGVDADWLFHRAEAVRRSISGKIERREHLRHRRNECWYRMDGAARRTAAEEACDGSRAAEWRYRTKVWKNRYRISSDNLRKLKVMPSHRDIGRVLDVPEGTVSSGIFLMRKLWTGMEAGRSGKAGKPAAASAGSGKRLEGPGTAGSGKRLEGPGTADPGKPKPALPYPRRRVEGPGHRRLLNAVGAGVPPVAGKAACPKAADSPDGRTKSGQPGGSAAAASPDDRKKSRGGGTHRIPPAGRRAESR